MSAPALTPPKTRAHNLRSTDVNDFPALTGREEEWRFTPLKRLGKLASATAAEATGKLSYEHDELPAGVSVSTVDRSDPRVGSLLTPFDRISALAMGGATESLLISVARGANPGGAAVVRATGSGGTVSPEAGRLTAGSAPLRPLAAAVTYAHTFVEVGDLAEATIVLDQSGSVTLADNVEVSVGAGAHLTLVTVADWEPDAVQAQHVKIRLGRDARAQHIQVALGGDLVRQYTSVEYAGRGGDCEAYGLYFATAGQHLEHRQLIDHSVPDCRSYVNYRGALQGAKAHTVWVGDVLIRAEATGTDTYEINRNLVLTDGARADSVPNLEIETGEVVGAGHASATGRFDDEQLFYLMSRGITEEIARKLVVSGFFNELLGKIPVDDLRARLSATIEARLGEVGA